MLSNEINDLNACAQHAWPPTPRNHNWKELLERISADSQVSRASNATKASVYRVSGPGRPVILKTYHEQPWWIRSTVGRLLIAREIRAYQQLARVAGVPKLVGRPAPWAILITEVPGRPLLNFTPGVVSPDVFLDLERILAQIHRAGIALMGLHHRDVMLSLTNDAHIVDFATVLFFKPTAQRRTYSRFQRACFDHDRVKLLKLKARYCDNNELATLATLPQNRLRFHRVGRAVQRAVKRVRSLWR